MEHKRANHPYIGREICSQKDGKAEGTYLANLPYNIKCQGRLFTALYRCKSLPKSSEISAYIGEQSGTLVDMIRSARVSTRTLSINGIP
jgi:hypothetical protein